ncbi:MAG: ribosome recycling factor [Candidatus Zixiibacteriota bacterium]|nr:MAG: ribosome recycling factor [candidate division Zixibacteria bacterium]
MLDSIYTETKERMKKTVDAIVRELSAIRTGKASVHLLDGVKVEAYGTAMPLNQVGTIAAPEPRLLVITAFDKSVVGEIARAIQKADLGLNPAVDGTVVRLPVPPLNEERRKELVKRCKQIAEEGRIAIRNVRRAANEQIKKAQKDKAISKDQGADGHDEVQEFTDDYIKQIDVLVEKKEKEVMEV